VLVENAGDVTVLLGEVPSAETCASITMVARLEVAKNVVEKSAIDTAAPSQVFAMLRFIRGHLS
jgi:hypothetical protein